MKTVILAGGLGTRLSEETDVRPKPMVEIGGKPILWHIMKTYSHFGFNDFIVCLGYKGYVIKEYFANYYLHKADVTIDLGSNCMDIHDSKAEPWRITLVDTGKDTMTGGRIRRVRDYIGDETFMMTYGDGVGNVDIKALVERHREHGKLGTVTSVQPSGRFGALEIAQDGAVSGFKEKPRGDGSWINGGFFVLEPKAIDYIKGDSTVWEQEPLEGLSSDGQLAAYKHGGFWQPMDTLRDKIMLNRLVEDGNAPWINWK